MAVRYGRNGYVARQYLTAAEDERVREAHAHKGYRRTVNKAGRIYTAVSLRIADWSLESIGEELGLTPQRVSKICQEYRLAGQNGRLLIVRSWRDENSDAEPWRDTVEVFPVPHIQDTVPDKNIYGEDIPVPVSVHREYAQVQRVEELTGIANIWPPPEKKPGKTFGQYVAEVAVRSGKTVADMGLAGVLGPQRAEDRMAECLVEKERVEADESLTEEERKSRVRKLDFLYWSYYDGLNYKQALNAWWHYQDEQALKEEVARLKEQVGPVEVLARENAKFRVVLTELGFDPDKIPDLPGSGSTAPAAE